jgi:hypothetical protein
MEQLTDFYEIRYLSNFRKSVIHVSLKSDKKRVPYIETNIILTISRAILLRMRKVSGKTFGENHNTNFTFNNVFLKSYHLWDNLEKYCTAGKITNNNMAHAHCVLDTKATNAHSECECEFPPQQWLYACPSMLIYMYTACLV